MGHRYFPGNDCPGGGEGTASHSSMQVKAVKFTATLVCLARISQMSCLTLACNLRQPFENKGFDAFHANVIGEPHG